MSSHSSFGVFTILDLKISIVKQVQYLLHSCSYIMPTSLFCYINGHCYKFAMSHKKNCAKHAHLSSISMSFPQGSILESLTKKNCNSQSYSTVSFSYFIELASFNKRWIILWYFSPNLQRFILVKNAFKGYFFRRILSKKRLFLLKWALTLSLPYSKIDCTHPPSIKSALFYHFFSQISNDFTCF